MKRLKENFNFTTVIVVLKTAMLFMRQFLENTVFGTDLLTSVIKKSNSLAKRTIVAFSSLVHEEVKSVLEDRKLKARVLNPEGFLLPFRVRYALECPEYMTLLKKREGLEYCVDGSYSYYHRIYYIEIRGNDVKNS